MTDANASLITEGNDGKMPVFAEQLTGDLKTDARLTSYAEKNLSDFVTDHFKQGDELKSLKETQEGMVRIPGEDADEATRNAFLKAYGRPDTVDGYQIDRPELPENMPYDEALEAQFKQTALELGLKPAQANKIAAMFNEYGITQFNTIQKGITENREKAENTLKTEWAGETYKVNVEKAKRAYEKFGGEEGKKWAETSGLGDDPMFIKLFHQVYEAIGDDHFISGDPAPVGDNKTPGSLSFPSMDEK